MICVNSITIFPQNKTMKVGQWIYFNETVSPSDATCKEVEWTSSNSNVATINTSGMVTAKSKGKTTIYAKAKDGSGVRASSELTVEDSALVTNITVTGSYKIAVGSTEKYYATVLPSTAENRAVRWWSAKPQIACVTAEGYVTGNAVGYATIYAEAKDGSGIKGSIAIKVIRSTTSEQDEGTDKSGNNTVADPVEVYSGAHTLKNTLMTLFGGQGISLVAQYNSVRLCTGSMGSGWYHNFEKHLEFCECETYVYDTPTLYSRYVVSEDSSVFTCSTPSKNGYVLTVDSASSEYPYRIDCNSEKTEYYDANGRLAKIVNHQGFETIITYSDSLITITDSIIGKSIYLEKNSDNRITRVYDDCSRQTVLTYSEDSLTNICDPNGNSLSYSYNDEGRIAYGTDSKNIRYFENTYDDFDRVATQKDGVGSDASLFTYEEDGTRITTNRNGDTSTRIFNESGMLQKHIDENGNETNYVCDANFNIVKETDGLGNSIIKTYNRFNKPTSITDKNGNKTTIFYDSEGNVLEIKYPEVGGIVPKESFSYNSRNQIVSHTDLRGTVTAYTYDSNGLLLTKKVGSKNAVQYVYENGYLKSETDAMGNTISYGYNALGQMTSKTDSQGNTTYYEYDLCGNLLKTTDANGKTLVNTYDGNYQKTSATDANGNKTDYSYTGNMKNDSVTLPDGNIIRYEYDGEDRLVKTTDQAGNISVTAYDKAGRVVSKQSADGGTVSYEYDKAGNVIKETNPKGAVTEKTYDPMGNVLTVTDDNGDITRYQYDKMSRVIRKVNSASGVTMYTYSAAGDLLCETDALGNKKRYTYDDYGNKLTATDALGNTTAYTYDANNNLLSVTDPLGNTTTYTYNSLNQLTAVKNAKNCTVTYGYDALGRRTTVTDAKNNVFTTAYDANGNITKVVDANGNTVSETVYNCLNLPATAIDASGKTTAYTYNSIGKVASVTDFFNNKQEYSYNAAGHNTQVKDHLDNYSTASYDVLGNITRLSGPLGGNTEYTYDNLGRLIAETTTSGGTLSYGYNELNLKEQLVNARGQKRKFFYDAAGRITGYVGAEDSVSYTYDANGNVLTVTDKNGTITRTYDALSRISSCTDTYGNTVTYIYDTVGNLERIIYPNNVAVTYAYDANNNLVKVTDWAGRVTTYTYDANNKVVGVTKPDGSITTTVYDNKQRITSTVEKTASGSVITGFEYTYDELGRISTETTLAENTKMCYTYDNLSRVIKRTAVNLSDNSTTEEAFTYDAAGNIIGDSSASSLVYDTNNRLTSYNGVAVEYDLDGNMLSNGANTFEYDSANRLIKAGDQAYTYNAEDVRIRNLCGDYDTTYTYNTNCKLSQLLTKTTNGITTRYVYGLGLIGEEKYGDFRTYHFDFRGSTVAITDMNGNITDTFKYDTYGKVTEHTGDSFVIFGYNGRDGVITDKNGLIYMRARYYSPELRRFINADILHGEISDSASLNRYAFVNGNPISFIDPFGLSKERGDQVSEYAISAVELYDNFKDAVDGFELIIGDVKFVKNGKYINIKGDRAILEKYGIKQTRIRADNIKNFEGIAKLSNASSAVSSALKSKSNWALAGITIAIETTYDMSQYEDLGDKLIIGSYDIVSGVIGAGLSMAGGAAVGAKVGSLISPGWGTLAGVVVGGSIGWAYDALVDEPVKEYLVINVIEGD